jgi:cytochrome c-type biogenesis protein CcmH/NrfF
MSRHLKYFGLLFMLLAAANSGVRAQEVAASKNQELAKVREVARELICPCPSCGGQALDQCHVGCTDGEKYRAEVQALLQKGEDKEAIRQHFASTYGQKMLGNPLPQGSGKWAMPVPYLAALLGLLPLGLWARSMRGRKRRPASGKAGRMAEDDQRLKDALHDFDY